MIKMTAKEVVEQYKDKRRNFHRISLRGQSFKKFKNLSLTEADFSGADIRGTNFANTNISRADFSGADIRGTNFDNTNLSQAKFIGAIGGIQKRWWLGQQLVGAQIGFLCGILSAFSAILIVYCFSAEAISQGFWFSGISSILLLLTIQLFLALQGFTAKAFNSILIAATVYVPGAVAVAGSVHVPGAAVVALIVALGVTLGVVVAVPVVGSVAGAVAFAGARAWAWTGAVFGGWIVAMAVVRDMGVDVALGVTLTLGVTLAFSLFGVYVAWETSKGNEKFRLLRIWGNALGSTGGTSFRGADLSHANFSSTILKNTNFNHTKQRQTILDCVNWEGAKKLNYARVDDSILANSALRELLVTRDGSKKSYVAANLRATNLDGVNLEQANMTWADLTCSTLCHANLKNANLTESLALNTDFTGANLTGACLEAWNIDSHTNLAEVDSQYVYLLRNEQERRPSSGNFAPGEFTKLFQEVLSTVDLIFRNGVDWKAFVTAFQQVQVENEDTPIEVQCIENKGDGVVVVRVNVPPDTDKTKIHSEFNQKYELEKAALEAKYRADLQAKDSEIIAIYREYNTNMLEVIKYQSNRPINIHAIAESKPMINNNDSSRKVVKFGDNTTVTGSTINLGSISGNVTNTINQLPDISDPNQPSLKELLTQLQAAIEGESSLPDGDKADLLGEVQNLAEAKQTEEPTKKEGLVRKAKKIFDMTLQSFPAAATLAKASNELLPVILKVLGFPLS
jgi:uncharacterized protein YjbI with pentapeptide repeats